MDLLNRRGNEFRASEALEKIPTNWSLAAIYPAIEKITQKSRKRNHWLHQHRHERSTHQRPAFHFHVEIR